VHFLQKARAWTCHYAPWATSRDLFQWESSFTVPEANGTFPCRMAIRAHLVPLSGLLPVNFSSPPSRCLIAQLQLSVAPHEVISQGTTSSGKSSFPASHIQPPNLTVFRWWEGCHGWLITFTRWAVPPDQQRKRDHALVPHGGFSIRLRVVACYCSWASCNCGLRWRGMHTWSVASYAVFRTTR